MPRVVTTPPCPSSRCTCVRCYEKYSRRTYVPLRDHLILRVKHGVADRLERLPDVEAPGRRYFEATIEAVGDGILDALYRKGVLVIARRGGAALTPDLLLVHVSDVLATFTEGTEQ